MRRGAKQPYRHKEWWRNRGWRCFRHWSKDFPKSMGKTMGMLIVLCRWWSRYPPADFGCALKEPGAHGKPTLEQGPDRTWSLWRGAGQDFLAGPVTPVPKGLNPEERTHEWLNAEDRTHDVAFLEEMPVWMTYITVVCEGPYPVDGISHWSRGAAGRESCGRGKVLLTECNSHFLSPCAAWGGGGRRGRSEMTLGGREGLREVWGFFLSFVLISHYSTQLFISSKWNYFPQVKTVLLMYIISLLFVPNHELFVVFFAPCGWKRTAFWASVGRSR